jgi:predicted amidohydrolase
MNKLRVVAFQAPELINDIDGALDYILNAANEARNEMADILLFPECFLQGYIVEQSHLKQNALDVNSKVLKDVLRRLSNVKPTIVLGFIELSKGLFYNSAAIIEQGSLRGVYRKTHLTGGEGLFSPGSEYPVFVQNGVTFGINICYDTQFAEAASKVAAQGAELLLVPAQNMMRKESAEKWKDLHNQIRAERAKESKMWLVSSDVTGSRDEHRIGYGPTSVINPQGNVVEQVPLLQNGSVVADIPSSR